MPIEIEEKFIVSISDDDNRYRVGEISKRCVKIFDVLTRYTR